MTDSPSCSKCDVPMERVTVRFLDDQAVKGRHMMWELAGMGVAAKVKYRCPKCGRSTPEQLETFT